MPPSEYQKPALQKLWDKVRGEPLIPLGCALTVAALVNAARAVRQGDHHKAQRMFRARVLAQGFTLLAMCGGGIYYAEDRRKERELWKLQQQQRDEEKRNKWIRELEARDAEDKALQERLATVRRRQAERAAAVSGGGADVGGGSPTPSSGSGWMGGWFGGKKSEAGTAPPEAAASAAAGSGPKKSGKANDRSQLKSLGELYSKKGSSAAGDKDDQEGK